MPTDHAQETTVVAAPFADVLAVVRDVESQTQWIKEVLTAELLEEFEDGTPATASFTATSPIGKDAYTLEYVHDVDAMRWTMVKGKLQTGQEGHYVLRDLGPQGTEVSFDLTIRHNLPVPGLIRNRVIKGLVHSTVSGLKKHCES